VFPRYAESRVRTALRDTRVVALSGPRQSGKTTLARRIAGPAMRYLTLDDAVTLEAALGDPVAFVRALDRAVIDEIQRAPGLLLAIKRSVDEDPRPGRFLLTGSANLMTIPTAQDSLAGRIEVVPLYPLSQAERLRVKKPQFLVRAFRGQVGQSSASRTKASLVQLASAGGYPEALRRRTESRRRDWYRSYLDAIVARDLRDVASLESGAKLPRVLEFAARFAGQLLNLSEIGRSVGLDHKTVERHFEALERLYLVRRVRPWHRNEVSRLVKTPKLHFMDSGLLSALRGHTSARLRHERQLFGPVLEGFVFTELLKACAWSEGAVSLHHFRDRDGHEVDFVLESAAGAVVGIEVKASATVTRGDFEGLRRLRDAAGTAFAAGVVLHDGEQTLAFADRLYAAPFTALWA
jgi:uncharacterized protein